MAKSREQGRKPKSAANKAKLEAKQQRKAAAAEAKPGGKRKGGDGSGGSGGDGDTGRTKRARRDSADSAGSADPAEDQRLQAELQRLRGRAIEGQLLSEARVAAGEASSSRPAADLDKELHVMLHNKGANITVSSRGKKKTRWLISLPGRLDMQASKDLSVGRLTKMDTLTPCMYINFPGGRVKLNGIRQRIKSRIIALELKTKNIRDPGDTSSTVRELQGVQCAEQFDSVICFPEFFWIGTKEENPEEKPLPFPPGMLKDVSETTSASRRLGTGQLLPVPDDTPAVALADDEAAAAAPAARSRRLRNLPQKHYNSDGELVSDDDGGERRKAGDEDEDEDEEEEVDEYEDEDEEVDDDDDSDVRPRRSSKASKAKAKKSTPKASAPAPSKKPAPKIISLVDDDDDSDNGAAVEAAGRARAMDTASEHESDNDFVPSGKGQSAPALTKRRSSGRAKPQVKYIDSASSGDEDDKDEGSGDNFSDGASDSDGAAAKRAANKKKKAKAKAAAEKPAKAAAAAQAKEAAPAAAAASGAAAPAKTSKAAWSPEVSLLQTKKAADTATCSPKRGSPGAGTLSLAFLGSVFGG